VKEMNKIATNNHYLKTTLKNITTKIGSGATPTGGKNSYKNCGISLIRSLNVYDFKFEYEDLAFIDDEQAAGLSNVQVERYDLLLNITGASVARCCMVPEKVLPARVNQHVAIVRINPKMANPYYVLYCLNSYRYKQKLLSIAQGGATREALTKEKIENFEISLPSLTVQKKIASILSAYDDLLENNTRRIKILEEMAQAIYKEWFTYPFRGSMGTPSPQSSPSGRGSHKAHTRHEKYPLPAGEGKGEGSVRLVKSELGMIPEGWEVKELGEIIELAYGKALKKDDRREGRFPVYGSGGICGYHDEILVEGPGIIVGRKGNVGSVFWSEKSFYPIDTVYYVKSIVGLYYLYFNLLSQNFINTDAAVPGLNRNQAYKNKLLLPPKNVMDKFTLIIKPVFNHVELLKNKNENLRKTRDLLLPKLINGEIDVYI
jgi:type I restriction enzyme S subunit